MRRWRSRRCCMMWWRIAEECRGSGKFAKVWRACGEDCRRLYGFVSASQSRNGSSARKIILREVKHADSETRLVSASDKLHNVRTILADYRQDGEEIWKRFNGKKEGTLWYYRALSDEYGRKPNRITRELEIVVTELERLCGVGADPARNGAGVFRSARGPSASLRTGSAPSPRNLSPHELSAREGSRRRLSTNPHKKALGDNDAPNA